MNEFIVLLLFILLCVVFVYFIISKSGHFITVDFSGHVLISKKKRMIKKYPYWFQIKFGKREISLWMANATADQVLVEVMRVLSKIDTK